MEKSTIATQDLWDQLINAIPKVKKLPSDINSTQLSVFLSELFGLTIIMGDKKEASHFMLLPGGNVITGDLIRSLPSSRELELYLPVALAGLAARRRKSAFAIAHFAQSLDGKIATLSGHSQWIGNEENLIHAHRMRALCDGVLIGANTLSRDRPRLNVRNVKGPDPARIIVGNGKYDISCLLSVSSPVYQIAQEGNEVSEGAKPLFIPKGDDEMDCHMVLARLFEEGLYNIYIEGGSHTSSTFLKQGAVDVVQLHIAPIVLGNGIDAFSLPLKETIHDSVGFEHHRFFRIGDSVMFQGMPRTSEL